METMIFTSLKYLLMGIIFLFAVIVIVMGLDNHDRYGD